MSTEISTQTTRGLSLQSVADAMTFANMLAKSDFAPKDFRGKPESCLLAIQHGAEIGLAPMQAVQGIAVVNGRPAIFGDTAKAVCVGSPVCEYIRETIEGDGDKMVAVCEAKRRGYPEATVSRFSVDDAKKAGLWGKTGPWSQYPRRMLQMRARGFALRDAFPDVLKGLVTAEEAQDYPTPEPAKEPVVVRPKFNDEPREGKVVLNPKPASFVDDDPEAKARLAISAARTIDDVDKIRRLIATRAQEGVFSADQAKELAGMCLQRAEMLTPADEVTA